MPGLLQILVREGRWEETLVVVVKVMLTPSMKRVAFRLNQSLSSLSHSIVIPSCFDTARAFLPLRETDFHKTQETPAAGAAENLLRFQAQIGQEGISCSNNCN